MNGQIPANLPYSQNFSVSNDFEFINGTQINKWFYGSATGNPTNSIYISNNNGTSNTYSTNSTSITHAYRDIVIPAGASIATLSFDWKANGGVFSYDYLRVWLVPASYMPVAGTQITAGAGRIKLGNNYNQQNAWQSYVNTTLNISSFAGNTMRLVFEWTNDDFFSAQPPSAAVDNINLLIPTCIVPSGLSVASVTSNTSTISWTAPSPLPGNGYAYYITTANVPPVAGTLPTGTNSGTSVNLTALVSNTTYYWWVKSVCSPTESSSWVAGPSFMTTQIPATIPYSQDFSAGNDFGFVNGTQINKWFYGSATGNPANSIYISDNSGTSNTYSTSSISITHAYRDIAIPAGASIVTLSFDWKANGGIFSYDYLRVWLVPVSYMPVAGTQITAGAGRIKLGNNYNQQNAWQSYLNTNLDISSFAGNTMRLVFEWTNDDFFSATPPPAAVDNIKLFRCTPTTPVVTVNGITHNAATVTWPQASGGTSYILRYRPVSNGTWTTLNLPAVVAPGMTNTFNLLNLLPLTQYEVEIAAVCNGSTTVYSHNEFSTKCDPSPPSVTISNIIATSALVTWAPLAAGSTYYMRWKKVGVTGWPNPIISLPAAPANTYVLGSINSLEPDTAYEVEIASQCAGQVTPNLYSNPAVFTTERVCEMPPPGLTITNLAPTSAEIRWDPFPGAAYIFRYRKVGIPSWTNISLVTNKYLLTGLTELTKYEMQVANICNGVSGTCTPLYYFTTPTVIYCNMSSGDSTNEYLSKVTIKPYGKVKMENISESSKYTDYTENPATMIDLIQGSVGNEISVEKSWKGTNHDQGIVAWIDFNRNGDFDIDERILVSHPNTTTPVSATFNVPVDAFVSMTDYKYVVMRVAMQRNGLPVNCTDSSNGEVEDYRVRISKQPVLNSINQTDILIYPNPVSSVLYVKNISKKADYKIYSATGQLIKSGILLNNKIDVSKLINGVFIIDIKDDEKSVQKKFIKEQ
ncbi:fibronectin type III domain-containing protein [Chryseobacterium sp. OV279]|uniref:fibronectin type III domain-containing protein n=1 Tax=Chryseobacterium sp. OV279 TaxID=1500285 RepID=UPI000934645B|nr:fibronectin type III domain-containing protein [Chryseobacterium sp. OV279]